MKKLVLSGVILASLLTGCKKDEKDECDDFGASISKEGVLIVSNEGPFSSGSGTLSGIDLTKGKVVNDLYSENNCGAQLGSILQKIWLNDEHGYALVNNADEVVKFDPNNFTSKKTLSITYPRSIAVSGNYGYISGGNADGKVTKINVETGEILSSVTVGENPQGIVAGVSWAITTNYGSWPNNDSTISVVNTSSMTLDTNIHVGLKPNDAVLDANGDLWVLVTASYISTAKPELVRLDTTTWTIEERVELGGVDDNVSKISINGTKDKIYFPKSDGIYVYSIGQTVSSTPVVEKGNHSNFYGLEVNPNNGHIFTFDAKDYSSKGLVREFDLSGDSVAGFEVGVIPNGGVFK